MTKPLHIWRCGSFVFEQTRPLVMGVLNTTPDSFSDGGKYSNILDALYHANSMLDLGADIIDVGGESTSPGSLEVSPAEELNRVLPVVKALVGEGICVSVDSRHPEVIEACLGEGASIINDITGFTNAAMRDLAQKSTAGCVVMHMQGTPSTMQRNPLYNDVGEEVSEFLLSQARELTQCGVKSERICLDPGPGFGKTHEQNLQLLRSTDHFSRLSLEETLKDEPGSNQPFLLMSAWSRKRFIGNITGAKIPSERVVGSVAVALYTVSKGAGVLRVHDVGATVEALKIFNEINGWE